MQVSVETLKGLERKVTISVPTEKIEEEVSQRLKKLGSKAKVDGFRPGKVPPEVVKKRFSSGVRLEVAKELIQSTLYEALKEKDLVPAGYPSIEPGPIEANQDFTYTAHFEVFPEIKINELNQAKVEVIESAVKETDLQNMLDKLRDQNKDWVDVDRKVAMGDKIIMDFKGFIDGEAFEGGNAEAYELVIGSGSMIPGFEDGIIGATKDKEIDVEISFPEDYGHKSLAGKAAVFKITVTNVMEGVRPELDDAFAEKFNVKEGGVEALKKDIKQNMERELERRVSSKNRENAFDSLLEKNKFDIPSSLIEQEIANLKHEMYHRVFGHEHSENEKIPDFPRELFEEQAVRRVHLGLLFSEYVKAHEIKIDKTRVDAMIDKLASAYEKPEELRSWYQGDKERMGEIEALVMEEMVADKILEDAKIVKVKMDYETVMNPEKDKKADAEAKGE